MDGKIRELPQKIERRLADLVRMGEFGQDDVSHCRRTYWAERDDWHRILIDCYDQALRRQQGKNEISQRLRPAGPGYDNKETA